MVDLLEKKENEFYSFDVDESIRGALQKFLRSDGLDVKIFSLAEEFLENGNLS